MRKKRQSRRKIDGTAEVAALLAVTTASFSRWATALQLAVVDIRKLDPRTCTIKDLARICFRAGMRIDLKLEKKRSALKEANDRG